MTIRKPRHWRATLVLTLLLCAASPAHAVSWSPNGSCVEATYVVPAAITRLHVTAIGAQGGEGTSDIGGTHHGAGGAGGLATKVVATVNVTSGQSLYVSVADPYVPFAIQNAGFGGGPGGATHEGPVNIGNGGGSATYISNSDPRAGGGCAPSGAALVVVAAGGGGGGGASSFANGGAGGTETVASGYGVDGGSNRTDDGAAGSGASATVAGTGGAAGHSTFCFPGIAGAVGGSLQGGYGGDGGSSTGGQAGCQGANSAGGSGGGGGGGRFGGGGGGGGSDNSTTSTAAGGGGGAGSSWIAASATLEQPLARACFSLCRVVDPAIVTITPYDTNPVILTGNSFTMTAGVPFTTTLRAGGYPLPQMGVNGGLPGNVFQTDNHDGTLTISGTPSINSPGVSTGVLTAGNTDGNGVYHPVTQSITFTVATPPRFVNPSLFFNGFSVGTAGHFDVSCYGAYPAPALTVVGALPAGVTLVDNGNCTGRFTGTPTQGGIFDVVLKATNATGQATQAIHLESLPIPVTVTVGASANPSAPTQSVTFNAQITPAPNNNPYVEFRIDGFQHAFVNANSAGLATAPALATLSAGAHTITAISNAGQFASGTGTLVHNVTVTAGPASGTTLSATPAVNAVYFASGRVYNRTFGNVDTGIDASYGSGLAIDAAGNIYTFVAGGGGSRVRKTAPNGSSQDFTAVLTHGAYGVAVDGTGNVFAVEGDRVTRIRPDGTSGYVLSGITTSTLYGVAADSAGNVFLANIGSSSNSSEILQLVPPYSAAPLKVARGLASPRGLAVDQAGNLYFADYGAAKVYRVALRTGVRTTLVSGFAAEALAIDAAGTLYLGSGAAIFQLAAPYVGAPLPIDSGRTPSGIATRQLPSATLGQPITLKANTISAPAGAFPAGTVTFKEGATTLGSGTLDANGVVTFATSSLPIGPHSLTASYPGGAAFPASSGALDVVVTPLPVPVTVTATRVRGSTTVNFSHVVGALPAGITGVTGTMSGCTSSTSPGTSVGTYLGTIFGCTGLVPTGPSAGSYAVQYIDGGVTITVQPLPINVVGRSVVSSGVFTYTWTTPITLPPGTVIAGTLSGCSTTLTAATPVGSYNGTISGCTGLTVTGPAAGEFNRIYVDAGVNVVPPSIAVTVTATKPFGGGISPTFSYTVPPGLPAGVTTVTGTLTGCTSSVVPTTPVGSYNGTINTNACAGLTAQGPNGPNFTITFVDGGITVTPRGVTVQIFGSQLPGGTPLYRFTIVGGFPRDIQGFGNSITGCTTTVGTGAAAGTYNGTITGCGGLGISTSTGVVYAITYVDSGFTVGPGGTNTAISATPVADPDLFVTARQFRRAILQAPPYTQTPTPLSTGAGAVSGTAFDSRGNLVFGDFINLYIADPTGVVRRTIPQNGTIFGNIVLDSNDNIFGIVTDGNSRASVYRLDFPYTGAPVPVYTGFGGVGTLAIDSSDRLFVADQFGKFTQMMEKPYTTPPVIVSQKIFSTTGIAVDNSDNLYIAINGNGPGTPSKTERYLTPWTGAAFNFSGDVISSNQGPQALTTDRQGNLWGTDQGGLIKIPAVGGSLTRLNNNSDFNQALQVSQSNPPAITTTAGSIPVTVTVGSVAGGTPGGTVSVFEGATLRASGPLTAGKATFSISGLSEGTHFLTASYAGAAPYSASASNSQRVQFGRPSATILFTNAPALAFGANATVTAVATSAVAVTFSTSSPACTVTSAGVVTGVALGACTITANAVGNATFMAAIPTTITLTVVKGNQTIVFGIAPTVLVGGTGAVSTTVNSGLAVTYSSGNSTCTVTPAGVVTGVTVGPCVVAANQAGNGNYNAAPAVTQTVNIGPGTQAITFDPLPAVTVGTGGIVSAIGGATFNPVTFATASSNCTVTLAGVVTGVHAGSCAINATQAGSTNYAAGSASTTLAVTAGAQTISFGDAGSVFVGGSGSVPASASSGLPVSFSSSSANCSVTPAGVATGLHVGSCSINAAQAGNADYQPAATASLAIAIAPGTQAIAFGSVPSVVVGGTGTVNATGGGSNNPVTFSTTSTTCSVTAAGVVTGIAGGACVIDAAQAANADYLAAAPATQAIFVAPGVQSITFGTAPSVEVLGTGQVAASSSAGLNVTFSSASTACTVGVTGVVTGIAAGTCVVSAAQAGNGDYAPATATQNVAIVLVVRNVDLTIDVDDGTRGSHILLGGLPVHYTITVTNEGPATARNALISDVLPSNLSGATWSCELPAAGSCTPAGSGPLLALATILPGGNVVLHFDAIVQAVPEMPVTYTVAVAPGVTEADTDVSDNSATTTSAQVIAFADGFESIAFSRPITISVANSKAFTDAMAIDLSQADPTRRPSLAVKILDPASGRMATVYLRDVAGQMQAQLSWRGEDGAWQRGAWIPIDDPARFVVAWSTAAGAHGLYLLDEVDIAQGAALLDRAGK